MEESATAGGKCKVSVEHPTMHRETAAKGDSITRR